MKEQVARRNVRCVVNCVSIASKYLRANDELRMSQVNVGCSRSAYVKLDGHRVRNGAHQIKLNPCTDSTEVCVIGVENRSSCELVQRQLSW